MTLKKIILFYGSLTVIFVNSFVEVLLVCGIMYVLCCRKSYSWANVYRLLLGIMLV